MGAQRWKFGTSYTWISQLNGVEVFYAFYVADPLSDEMIIGADMLQRWKIKLDPEAEEVYIDPDVVARIRV